MDMIMAVIQGKRDSQVKCPAKGFSIIIRIDIAIVGNQRFIPIYVFLVSFAAMLVIAAIYNTIADIEKTTVLLCTFILYPTANAPSRKLSPRHTPMIIEPIRISSLRKKLYRQIVINNNVVVIPVSGFMMKDMPIPTAEIIMATINASLADIDLDGRGRSGRSLRSSSISAQSLSISPAIYSNSAIIAANIAAMIWPFTPMAMASIAPASGSPGTVIKFGGRINCNQA